MTTKTNTFKFAGLELRSVTIDGQPWFVAKDVCEMLGLSTDKGAGRHLTNLKSSEVSTYRFHGTGRPNTIITESGLYALVMRAQKANPKAREFQNWVTGTVLPAIRKTGGYLWSTLSLRRDTTSFPMWKERRVCRQAVRGRE